MREKHEFFQLTKVEDSTHTGAELAKIIDGPIRCTRRSAKERGAKDLWKRIRSDR